MTGRVVEAAGTYGVESPGGTRSLVESVLARLRDEGRRAIRIVDVDCGTGRRLAGVVRLARAMGFIAVEARGCTASCEAARAAAAASARRLDAGVGWNFDAVDPARALAGEQAEGDADLILAPRTLASGPVAGSVIPIGRTRRIRAAQASRPARPAPARRPVAA